MRMTYARFNTLRLQANHVLSTLPVNVHQRLLVALMANVRTLLLQARVQPIPIVGLVLPGAFVMEMVPHNALLYKLPRVHNNCRITIHVWGLITVKAHTFREVVPIHSVQRNGLN